MAAVHRHGFTRLSVEAVSDDQRSLKSDEQHCIHSDAPADSTASSSSTAFAAILERPGKPRRLRPTSAAATRPRSTEAPSRGSSGQGPRLPQQERNKHMFPPHRRPHPASSGRSSTWRRISPRPKCGRTGTMQTLSVASSKRTTRTVSPSPARICQSD